MRASSLCLDSATRLFQSIVVNSRATALAAIVIVIVFGSSVSLAQGPGWTALSTVVEVVNTANGGVNVRLSPDLGGCVSQSGYGSIYASLYPSHPGINRMKADLLLALSTGQKVMLYLGDSQCQFTEMRLYPPQ
jgi:hypothetical protein